MKKLRVLSLFSGVGMIDLGLQWAGMEIVGQVEIEPYCRAVLEKHWPGLWRREDVQAVTDDEVRALAPDVIAGGFPCQDVSVAGKGKGVEHGERSGLWREFARLIRAARPRWVIAENVPGLRTRGADLVLSDLEEAGYACWPLVVGAEHVGAPHKRHRVWIVGYSGRAARERNAGGLSAPQAGKRGKGQHDGDLPERSEHADTGCCGGKLADTISAGRGTGRGTAEREGREGQRGDSVGGSGDVRPVADTDHTTGPAELIPGCAAHQAAIVAGSGGGDVAYSVCCGGGQDRRAAELRPVGVEQPPCYSRPTCPRTTEQVTRWPAGPGPYQHSWEAPRLTQSGVGNTADGAARRLAGFARRNALKALGNGAVPQVVCEVGKAVVDQYARTPKEPPHAP